MLAERTPAAKACLVLPYVIYKRESGSSCYSRVKQYSEEDFDWSGHAHSQINHWQMYSSDWLAQGPIPILELESLVNLIKSRGLGGVG